MNHLRLHRRSELDLFIANCSQVINRSVYDKSDHIKKANEILNSQGLHECWKHFAGNRTLWEDGYNIFLDPLTKATFMYYRNLDAKTSQAKLSRKIKESK
ncbi:hypothetical protein Acj9p142 [Acinetobacter phage Acj9]|uniref:Uncharacterized protein n=1 Tax=Acinetobacter phage Acj9 TaxID=760939 RepID=E5EPS6_9CAUD|nr:hypothetical protein Acj9p142 [Acinetobacter phage Acj9]ADG60042.1 hypothetical protein Acj9p142 [Acinetobacter phage Acj9]